jgi:hypothetical protein
MDSVNEFRLYAEEQQVKQPADALELIGLLFSALIRALGQNNRKAIPRIMEARSCRL